MHFRSDFHDSGFAASIYLVEPPEAYLGTDRLEGLPYENVELKKFFPLGDPEFVTQHATPPPS